VKAAVGTWGQIDRGAKRRNHLKKAAVKNQRKLRDKEPTVRARIRPKNEKKLMMTRNM
jgi:hypothetical protein